MTTKKPMDDRSMADLAVTFLRGRVQFSIKLEGDASPNPWHWVQMSRERAKKLAEEILERLEPRA